MKKLKSLFLIAAMLAIGFTFTLTAVANEDIFENGSGTQMAVNLDNDTGQLNLTADQNSSNLTGIVEANQADGTNNESMAAVVQRLNNDAATNSMAYNIGATGALKTAVIQNKGQTEDVNMAAIVQDNNDAANYMTDATTAFNFDEGTKSANNSFNAVYINSSGNNEANIVSANLTTSLVC
ncbi:hypothetical protein K9L27_00730 [Candidatus Gracilibacteria bacterium]|nr:hypothetical protein [Candidatus Gracilibacteria bacterium]